MWQEARVSAKRGEQPGRSSRQLDPERWRAAGIGGDALRSAERGSRASALCCLSSGGSTRLGAVLTSHAAPMIAGESPPPSSRGHRPAASSAAGIRAIDRSI